MGSSDSVCHRNATHCRQRLIVKRRSRRRRVPQLNPRVSFQLTPPPNGKLPLALVVNQHSTIKAGAGGTPLETGSISWMLFIVWSR